MTTNLLRVFKEKRGKVSFFLLIILLSSLLTIARSYYQGKFGSHFKFRKVTYSTVPNWQADDHTQALKSFMHSCQRIMKQPSNAQLGPSKLYGQVKDWQAICVAGEQVNTNDPKQAKRFFEKWFEPYKISNNYNPKVLFTGYFLPLINVSYHKEGNYTIPIYTLPSDLIHIKLPLFSQEFKGRKSLVGQLRGNNIYPYPSREEINQGALNHSKAILWCNNKLDLFYTQIQGSAVAQFPDGQKLILGYAGDNGRKYTPIGKVLLQKKVLNKKDISMQSIRTWLEQHPQEIDPVLNQDASYVFFKLLKQSAPVGTQTVPLTPERSLAVDTHYIPLGAPIWVNTYLPTETNPIPYHHLLIAQDTGGAIKGMHGDIYLGSGERAAFIAGHAKSDGQWWLFLPKIRTSP